MSIRDKFILVKAGNGMVTLCCRDCDDTNDMNMILFVTTVFSQGGIECGNCKE